MYCCFEQLMCRPEVRDLHVFSRGMPAALAIPGGYSDSSVAPLAAGPPGTPTPSISDLVLSLKRLNTTHAGPPSPPPSSLLPLPPDDTGDAGDVSPCQGDGCTASSGEHSASSSSSNTNNSNGARTSSIHPAQANLSRFILLLRVVLPDLYALFDEVEIDSRAWAAGWLSHLLAGELPLASLLRLWDSYFASPEGVSLHPYVCVAILRQFQDELDELDRHELLSFLRCLPHLDMEQILADAHSIRLEVSEMNIM